MTSEYAPGLLKYDVCMTEQVSGPQGTKIAGRHMVMIPKSHILELVKKCFCRVRASVTFVTLFFGLHPTKDETSLSNTQYLVKALNCLKNLLGFIF